MIWLIAIFVATAVILWCCDPVGIVASRRRLRSEALARIKAHHWCQGCDRVVNREWMEWDKNGAWRCWKCSRGNIEVPVKHEATAPLQGPVPPAKRTFGLAICEVPNCTSNVVCVNKPRCWHHRNTDLFASRYQISKQQISSRIDPRNPDVEIKVWQERVPIKFDEAWERWNRI